MYCIILTLGITGVYADQADDSPKNGTDSFLNQGNDLLKNKNYSGALNAFNQEIESNPQNVDAWSGKGYVLYVLDRDTEAFDALEKALELDPDNSYASDTVKNLSKHLSNKGSALIQSKNFSEGLKALNLALQLNPKDTVALNNKAYILENTGKYEEALEVINQAVEINPQFTNGWLTKGYILAGLGKKEESLEAFNQTLKLNPNNKNAKWGINYVSKNQT